jgi:N-acylneuraminate cytidylyltransferase
VSAGSAPSVVAVIPARGGSKGLPRKNLRPLAGHPLIAWSIAAARHATTVDAVVVSTDDEEIAAVARACGASVPFLRPHELARDETPDLPVFEHALAWLTAEHGRPPEVIVQLRPTSPLRPAGLVDAGVGLLRAHPDADSLRAVTSPSQTPYKMWQLRGSLLEPLLGSVDEELFNRPRQKLPAVYWQTGHLDVIPSRTILERRSMTGRRVLAFPVEPRYALDIDALEQLELAEWLLDRGSLEVVRPDDASRRCA